MSTDKVIEKITLAQAAAAVHVHVNTVKNWRRANELKTAEKIIERGIEVWYVELSEVEEKARQKKNKTTQPSNQQENIVDYPTPDNNPGGGQLPALVPQVEQFMSLVERSQQPLLDRLDKLTARNEELALEVGQLRERLKNLEAGQAAQDRRSDQELAGPVIITPQVEQPPKKRRWWQF